MNHAGDHRTSRPALVRAQRLRNRAGDLADAPARPLTALPAATAPTAALIETVDLAELALTGEPHPPGSLPGRARIDVPSAADRYDTVVSTAQARHNHHLLVRHRRRPCRADAFGCGSVPRSMENRKGRTIATVLDTDIVGSTEHLVRIGDDAWERLICQPDGLIPNELNHHHGRAIRHTGDGPLAIFAHPGPAIECACTIRDKVSRLGLRIRAGLHTGECTIARGEIHRLTVHVSARIAAMAQSDEILASSVVRELISGGAVEFTGEHALKGLPTTWRLHAIPAPAASSDIARS
ncbi:MAG TPA: adenylate/guanylate cyclase domain-containing protein [Solirubrobacteraceae bacterium]|nr:adenylate/guanylate cyclase domain-containing protein [Solirubrobacteraceae bacterium]